MRLVASIGAGLGSRYWRVWSAHASSNFGDGILLVALPLLAVSLTDDARLIGLVAAARAIPLLFIGPFAGVLADRVDRKRLMVSIDLLRAAIAGLLAALVVTDRLSIWILIAAGAILGTAEVPFDVSAPAILRQVVEPEDLEIANARVHSAQMITNDFAGGPIGGVLYAVAPWLPLVTVGTSFGGASATLAGVEGDFQASQESRQGSVRTQLLDGHRYLWGHSLFRPQALSVCALAFTGGMTNAVFVVYVTERLGLGSVGFGLLGAVVGLSALAMATVVARVIRLAGHGRTMAMGVLAMAVGALTLGLTDNVAVAVVGLAITALGDPLWNIVSISARQRLVPDEIFGRVAAAYLHVAWSLIAVGAIVGGFIAEEAGAESVYLAAMVFQVGVLFFGRRFFREMTAAMST